MEIFILSMLLSLAVSSVKAQGSTSAPSTSLGNPTDLSSYPYVLVHTHVPTCSPPSLIINSSTTSYLPSTNHFTLPSLCAQVCGNEANQYPRCDRSNLTCVCGPSYRSMTAACESLTCSPSEYRTTQLLAAQLCNPTYTNASASSVSVAIASATANATIYAGGKDPTDINNLPTCAQNCINQYLPGSTCGSLSNRACVCQGGKGRDQLDQCERANCSATDLQILQYFVYALCTPVGGLGNSTNVTLPTQVPPVTAPVATFTGEGVGIFVKGMGWMNMVVVGTIVIGL